MAALLGSGEAMIYLATPYSDHDPAVMEARFDQACAIAGALMAKGEIVFSPIAYTHHIAVRCSLPRGWGYWERYDREMIVRAAKVVVVKIAGWQESQGIRGEIAIAREFGIPIEFMEIRRGDHVHD